MNSHILHIFDLRISNCKLHIQPFVTCPSSMQKLRMNNKLMEKVKKKLNVVILYVCVNTHLFTPTFMRVSQHCDPALTHQQPLLTEPVQLKQTNNSEKINKISILKDKVHSMPLK